MVANADTVPPVHTNRLCLRCAEERDATALAGLMSEAVSRRLASWPVPYTPVMALDRIAGVRMAAAERRSLPLVVERRADGAVLGWISISRAPGDPATALITYWLGEDFQGLGYMREAAPAAMREAFALMDIARLRAAVQADNAASLAVVRLLGMAPMGEGRIWCPSRGRDEPCQWFELRRDDAVRAQPERADAAS
ncbi:GNAT family N-acetyltransferase [Roseomonas sp. CAU 1739]|uniref:GNAT family N-acetyltransferase n=1 Tax=Roseomonas sp. CAU 1739 TaxID=3140364 RepID=UPI00325BA5A9